MAYNNQKKLSREMRKEPSDDFLSEAREEVVGKKEELKPLLERTLEQIKKYAPAKNYCKEFLVMPGQEPLNQNLINSACRLFKYLEKDTPKEAYNKYLANIFMWSDESFADESEIKRKLYGSRLVKSDRIFSPVEEMLFYYLKKTNKLNEEELRKLRQLKARSKQRDKKLSLKDILINNFNMSPDQVDQFIENSLKMKTRRTEGETEQRPSRLDYLERIDPKKRKIIEDPEQELIKIKPKLKEKGNKIIYDYLVPFIHRIDLASRQKSKELTNLLNKFKIEDLLENLEYVYNYMVKTKKEEQSRLFPKEKIELDYPKGEYPASKIYKLKTLKDYLEYRGLTEKDLSENLQTIINRNRYLYENIDQEYKRLRPEISEEFENKLELVLNKIEKLDPSQDEVIKKELEELDSVSRSKAEKVLREELPFSESLPKVNIIIGESARSLPSLIEFIKMYKKYGGDRIKSFLEYLAVPNLVGRKAKYNQIDNWINLLENQELVKFVRSA